MQKTHLLFQMLLNQNDTYYDNMKKYNLVCNKVWLLI